MKHVQHLSFVLGWCESALCPQPLRILAHEAVVSGIIRYALPFISKQSPALRMLQKAVCRAVFRAEKLPFDFSSMATQAEDGIHFTDVVEACKDATIVTAASLVPHSLRRVK